MSSTSSNPTANDTKFGFLFQSGEGFFKCKPLYWALVGITIFLFLILKPFIVAVGALGLMRILSMKDWKQKEQTAGRTVKNTFFGGTSA